jgi:Ran GTPase-activating protein (RanGAP) involved in mRNA processing and transport
MKMKYKGMFCLYRKSNRLSKAADAFLRSDETKVDLNGCDKKEFQGVSCFRALIKITMTNAYLKEISLKNCGLQTIEARLIADSLMKNYTLEILDLGYNSIGPSGAGQIANALKINNTLQKIDLGSNNIANQGAQAIAEALKVNKPLKNVILMKNSIYSEGAQYIAEALKINSSLTFINLSDNDIGMNGALEIARALKVNNSLKTIMLQNTNIYDYGAQQFSEALKINSTLMNINLFDSSITKSGIQALVDALKINSSLLTLNLKFPGGESQEYTDIMCLLGENYVCFEKERIFLLIQLFHHQARNLKYGTDRNILYFLIFPMCGLSRIINKESRILSRTIKEGRKEGNFITACKARRHRT